jgi:sugar-specific transcriptional regulator TrmB
VEHLARALTLLGVGKREIDIYLTLVEKGSLSAKELSEQLGIPYTKVYSYLSRLEKLGLVLPERAVRPAKFKAAPPADVYKKLVGVAADMLRSLKPLFDSLQMVYESRYAAVAPTFLTLLRGAERVAELIQEVVATAEGEVYLAIPFEELVDYRLLAVLSEESKRLSIKILTTERLGARFDLPPRVDVRIVQEMFGGGAIGTAVVIFVKYGGEITGLYSNDKFLIEVARTYFDHLWRRAKVL